MWSVVIKISQHILFLHFCRYHNFQNKTQKSGEAITAEPQHLWICAPVPKKKQNAPSNVNNNNKEFKLHVTISFTCFFTGILQAANMQKTVRTGLGSISESPSNHSTDEPSGYFIWGWIKPLISDDLDWMTQFCFCLCARFSIQTNRNELCPLKQEHAEHSTGGPENHRACVRKRVAPSSQLDSTGF